MYSNYGEPSQGNHIVTYTTLPDEFIIKTKLSKRQLIKQDTDI